MGQEKNPRNLDRNPRRWKLGPKHSSAVSGLGYLPSGSLIERKGVPPLKGEREEDREKPFGRV